MSDDDPTRDRGTGSDGRPGSQAAGPSRRRLLRASAALGGGTLAGVPVASAQRGQEGGESGGDGQTDQPEGFGVELLAAPAAFTDQVAAMFSTSDGDTTVDSNLPCDASNLLVARASWEPGGTSGWHLHPGVGIVNVTGGEIELVDEDCGTSTYAAGEAFLDPGDHAHTANNASDTEPAEAYVTFLGVPGESPATEWVEPRDC